MSDEAWRQQFAAAEVEIEELASQIVVWQRKLAEQIAKTKTERELKEP